MSSQFDDLLGDFGGDTSSSSAPSKPASNGDSGMLLDFTTNNEISNGQTDSNGVDFQVTSSSSSNPLYDFELTSGGPSANPLYDFEQQPQEQPQSSSNNLYDFDFTNADTSDNNPPSANPLYDFSTEDDSAPSQPAQLADPFAEFESLSGGGDTVTEDSSVDLLSGTNQLVDQGDTSNNQGGGADLLGDFSGGDLDEPQQEEISMTQEGDSGIQEISGTSEINGNNSLLDLGSGVDDVTTTVQEQGEEQEEEHEVEQEQKEEDVHPEEPQVIEEESGGVVDEEEVAKTGGIVDNTNEEEEEPETPQQPDGVNEEDDTVNVHTLPDLVVTEDGDEEVDQVPQEVNEEMDQGPPEADDEMGQASQEGDKDVVEAPQEVDEEVDQGLQEGDKEVEEAPQEVDEEVDQGLQEGDKDVEEAPQEVDEEVDQGPQEVEVDQGPQECDKEVEQAPQEVDEEVDQGPQGATSDVTGDQVDEYSDDRREEDLEQYCIDRGVSEEMRGEDVEERENQIFEDVEMDQVDGHNEMDQVDGHNEIDQVDGHNEMDQISDQGAEQEQAEDQPQPCEDTDKEVEQPEVLVEDDVQQTDDAGVPEEDAAAVVDEVDAADQVVPEEKEEVTEDSQTVSKPTRTESQSSTGSGFEQPAVSQPVSSNQWPEDNSGQQETPQQETTQSSEMSSRVANRYQSGPPEPAPRQQYQQQFEDDDDEEEEGVYENEPVRRDDVARESDNKEDPNLLSPGLAQNLLAKFASGQSETSTPRAQREITPPNPTMGGGEYVSEPRVVFEKYEGKAESGVFESEPQHNPDIVRSDSCQEEAVPEQGYAKKFAARYTQIDRERKSTVMTSNREIATQRGAAQVEYVSEPREHVEKYVGKAESGVFESEPEHIPDVVRSGDQVKEEAVPERGTAKNLAERFHQISVDAASPQTSRNKREITPDSSGRSEFVSEPREHVEQYESKTESGVFENTPQEDPDIVKAGNAAEEYIPERGFARNVAAKFKELENTAKSPPLSPGRRKEFTPPREDINTRTSSSSGVYESSPETKPDVVTSAEAQQEVLPGAGTARSLAQRYKEIEAHNRSPVTSKTKKEFTPPPQENTVYENQPDRFQADYNRPAESGIVENQPIAQRDDVLKGSEKNGEVELPEAGSARNLVSKWRQIETESAKTTSPGSAGRNKEFTPPREEPRIYQNSKSPRTPKSPTTANAQLDNGSVHPSDLPGQYQPQNEPNVFESNPEPNTDACRESDTDKSKGMPKKNQAKKMLARFQSIEAEANKEQPQTCAQETGEDTKAKTFRKASVSESNSYTSEPEEEPPMENTRLKFEDPEQVGRSKSMRAAIQVEKCGACDKTVYAMERLEMNKRVYHRACFRCSQCKAVLTPKTFAINNGVIFCTTHYKQNFTTKGNYDEGFGRQQHKKQWSSNPNIAGSADDTKASG